MRAIYYDTETTGVKPQKDRIVEIAAYDPERDLKFLSFIDPEMPIPAEATSISGITDEMVKGAPKFGEVAVRFAEFCSGVRSAVFAS
jgi:DNA polymerase-3 subunit epsilon